MSGKLAECLQICSRERHWLVGAVALAAVAGISVHLRWSKRLRAELMKERVFRERLIHAMESESEKISTGLQRRLYEARSQIVDLEQKLEEEQEYIINRLHRQFAAECRERDLACREKEEAIREKENVVRQLEELRHQTGNC
eukprot:GEMP01080097.1.p1 GENE.GEMP01080097.1~~GEMP01080097.1.p1  ORF type:complete len:142 (+),score=33.34 GEMP01080097.1:269-694(+)